MSAGLLLLLAFRYAWACPNTAIGLLATALTLATGGRARVHTGVIESWGGFAAWFLKRLVPLPGGASAMTLGHVVIARDEEAHERTRRHERVHVRQYERWGPAFLPAYGISAVLCKLRRLDPYFDNPFEKEAFAWESKR